MQTKTAVAIFSLTLGWMGCVAESNREDESATGSRLASSANAEAAPPIVARQYQDTGLTTLKEQTPIAIPDAIDIQPANGSVFDRADTSGVSITFTGFALESGQTIEVQVLKTPDLPIAEENWETIATGTASTTPTTFGDPTPIFRYSIVAQPGANGHWDNGGILRYRTLADHAGQQSLMPFYDAVSGDCIAQQKLTSWKDVMKLCKSPWSPSFGDKLGSTTKAAALVSSSPEPGDNLFNPPAYLSRKGFIFPSQTDDYYAFINAPESLDEFQLRFGFFDGGATASATYYNLGDLGIGREMHCAQFEDPDRGSSTACYVKNYGVLADGTGAFSGDPDSAMDDATSGEDLNFATVAMVKFGTTFDEPDPNDVQFFVYNSDDDLVDQAQLDSVGFNKSIPNNCTNCHGGNYDSGTGNLTGSTFLPFDPNAFLYSTVDGFTYEQQADQLQQLNAMMRSAGAPPGTAQFIDGTYNGNVNQPSTANLDWIPEGWATNEESKTVYRQVYKQYCRTCHTSQVGQFSFITYADFKQAAAQTMQDTCVTSQMPVCEATLGLFWRGGARAYLVNALDTSSSCTPGTF